MYAHFSYYHDGFFQIGFPISNTQKRIIWLDGGIHAREWAASTVALYHIKEVHVESLLLPIAVTEFLCVVADNQV